MGGLERHLSNHLSPHDLGLTFPRAHSCLGIGETQDASLLNSSSLGSSQNLGEQKLALPFFNGFLPTTDSEMESEERGTPAQKSPPCPNPASPTI